MNHRAHEGEPLPKVPSPPLSQFPAETPLGTAYAGRLELRHVEHLMDVCGDSHDGLMLLGTMAVVANVIRQRDAAEAALFTAGSENEALHLSASRAEDERLRLDQEVRDLRTALDAALAALAATQEKR